MQISWSKDLTLMPRKTLSILVIGSLAMPAMADGGFVAGLRPFERPQPHPTVRSQPTVPIESLSRGIEGFAPAQFPWFSHQGPWFTPFGSPGATGPYDFRQLHVPGKTSNQ